MSQAPPDNPVALELLPPVREIEALLGQNHKYMGNSPSHLTDPANPVSGQGLVRAAAALTLALRRAGSTVGLGSLMDSLRALDFIGLESAEDVRQALAAGLTASRAELETFNTLFDRYFLGLEQNQADQPGRPTTRAGQSALALTGARSPEGPEEKAAPYSPVEVLSGRDLRELAEEEADLLGRDLIKRLTPLLRYPSRRFKPGRGRDRIDFRRTLRRAVSLGGEPLVLARRRRKERSRRLVLLLDVSGSMDVAARTMVHFAKAWLRARPGKVEVYAFSTRLRRLTRLLADRPLAAALAEISRLMPEWSGGTRIGRALRELLSTGAFGPVSSSTVTAVFSDGWDRGDIDLLERQMALLARRSARVVWLNPLMGDPQYQPVCAGIRAALPYLDELIPAHSFKAIGRAGLKLAESLNL